MSLESETSKEKPEGPFEQFEPCDKKDCKYYNEAGRCSYETCLVKNEHPEAAPLVIKKCQACGDDFGINPNNMKVQFCPNCLAAMLKAEGHPHNCIFCGAEMQKNPSIFFPVCDTCMKALNNAIHCTRCGNG